MNTLSNISLVFGWLVITSCKGVAAILLVLLLRRILAHRITPQGRYLLWLPAIACFVMPFGWQVHYPLLHSRDHDRTSMLLQSQSIRLQPARLDVDKGPLVTAQPDDARHLDNISSELIKQGFIVLWLAGTLTLSLIVIRNTVRYARIRTGAKQAQGLILELFNDCKTTIGVDRAIELRESGAISSPIITGWWRPMLLLPEHLSQQLSGNEMRHIFLHELCHVKRLDLPMSWPMTMAQLLNWFNPLVWYMGREFRTDMEAACDAKVLGALRDNERTAYGHTLIKLSEPPVTGTLIECGAGIMERYSQLKARITMISQFNPPSVQKTAIAVFALSMIMPLACLQPRAIAASSNAQQSSATTTLTSEIVTPQPATSVASPVTPSTPQNRSTEEKAGSPPRTLDTADQNNNQELQSLYLKVEHAHAADLAAFVRPATGLSLLSDRGSMAVDTRTNSLLVHDTQENIEAVKELVARLDVPLKKVMIEAHMVIVDSSAIGELIARAKAGQTATNHQPVHIDLRQVVSRLGKNFDVNAEIAALQAAHKGEVISSPKILTEIRREAVIEQGIVVPGNVAKSPDDATPSSTQLLVNLKLQSDVRPESGINFDVSFSRESAPPPTPPGPDMQVMEKRIDDKIKIVTSEIMHDGETVMLADNYEQDKLKAGKRLLIFLTPRIMNEDGSFNL